MTQHGFKLRKGLFSGLTILLIAVFIYLAVQGNRLEKERQKREADVVETFKPTPVRALEPRDLEITAAFMEHDRPSGAGEEHRIEVRNSGQTTYGEIRFKLEYLDAGGEELEPLFRNVAEAIPPGMTELIFEIPQDEIPSGAVDYVPSIVYADIEPEGP